MDAELAASVIDDAFQAFGTPRCTYTDPDGTVTEGVTVLRHRPIGERSKPGFALGRGGLETTDRPQAVIVRASEISAPQKDGIIQMPARGGRPALSLRIGEDPVEDDVNGIAWRCPVEVL
jgi:hypothetical protein